MVGLTALLFLFVLGFILKRRVLRPVVRLSDVVNRLASQDYAVETPSFNQIDEIGDMAQAIRIFRENGLARQRLEKERDADWAIRELLARMTQRLQGCENFADVINVAELFAPNVAPGIAGRLYTGSRATANALRCAMAFTAGQSGCFPPGRMLGSAPRSEPSTGARRTRYRLLPSTGIMPAAYPMRATDCPVKPSACSHSRTSAMIPLPLARIWN